ncbi:MAG: NAD(P)/FAD-dependent oxidoreductase [Ardenticatenaceae bacterium]|nr:NAD(P)/FAD-dependent oxidoreductase [Anaerolineales bacterium]MCB8937401.1 NAD(P)/FAD-dependent oxidoreductase [Ardenticatenaceae bacterium]MCB8975405.1 NAD(P)/FAD-dependent oxidoreductase [Ardenticatenaceae bacterium]
MSKQIIIIGGGPAGIEAARAAAKAGSRVTLVSEGPVGGRSGWHSLLPSKVWLSAADTAGLLAESPFSGSGAVPTPAEILPRLQQLKQQWNNQQAEELAKLGVTIVNGVAAFTSANSVVVNDGDGQPVTTLTGDAIIVATGSVPFFPPNLKPNGKTVIAPRFFSGLKSLPDSMVVIGAGATGVEAVYLFNRLGLAVTWIVDQFGVLPDYPAAAGELMAEILVKRGVKLVQGTLADHFEEEEHGIAVVLADGRRYTAGLAFVAIGRTADLSRLNLDAAGLVMESSKFPAVDAYCQTSVPGIYAVGDAAGPPMVANRAMAMARVAGLHATGAVVAPYNSQTVVAAVYAEPQVAQVGTTSAADGSIQTVRLRFEAAMKAHLLGETEGFVELAFDGERKIVGGTAVGPHAGDVLAPVALAIQVGATLDELASIFAAHPTLSELAFAAARNA